MPSPQIIRVEDAFGSTRPYIVGFMSRPAPESIITSPSALHSEDINVEILVSTSPGSKGKLVVSISVVI